MSVTSSTAESIPHNQPILQRYLDRTPKSRALFERAKTLLPGGITHDSRIFSPYGIYTDSANGGHKTDVDGNRYIDFFGGHGALLLGHNHPTVLAAVQQALQEGTQFGTNHAREVAWAEIVVELVPAAELVRFTSSGTEATLLALRLSRAFTNKQKVLRFKSHFHGWHDHMAFGYASHFDGTPTPGVLASVAEQVILVDPGDLNAVEAHFKNDNDIAACIIEPTGGSFGMVPADLDFLNGLRDLTQQHGVLLIFDEVITGFRVSPGGAQALFGITPDLATFAKILAGGLPGGAVAGRRDVLALLDTEACGRSGREKIPHQGTFNANPVSAAAGLAALEIIRDTGATDKADATADALRKGMNEVLSRESVAWAVYGTSSGFHIFTNPENLDITPDGFNPHAIPTQTLKARNPDVVTTLRLAMLNEGIDLGAWPGGIVSTAHTEEDIANTCIALSAAIANLKSEGFV